MMEGSGEAAGWFEPVGLATAIGSMPHVDPREACSVVLEHLPQLPVWPQLPQRSDRENMYVQFSEGLPGLAVEGSHLYVDRTLDLSEPLEQLYAAYIDNTLDGHGLSEGYAAGLHAFLGTGAPGALAVKGQVTGPISFGLVATDRGQRPLLYDDILADAIAKHLRLKAAWQERALRAISPQTIIFVDEPYLASVGSAFVSIPQRQVVELLGEVFQGIAGLKGIHCCGNTDWGLLLSTSLDVLSFDAYGYGGSLGLYASEVQEFLERGGVIAWGLVPNEERALAVETPDTLLEHLGRLFTALEGKGISRGQLVRRCLITPSCGLAGLSPEAAKRALGLLAGVSKVFRERYA